MPKMVYINGNPVRAGSWSTKSDFEKWQMLDKHLKDAPLALLRVRSMLDYAREHDHAEDVVEQLKYVSEEIDATLAAFRQQRRIALLRSTEGRTPEEAAAYRTKADSLAER